MLESFINRINLIVNKVFIYTYKNLIFINIALEDFPEICVRQDNLS